MRKLIRFVWRSTSWSLLIQIYSPGMTPKQAKIAATVAWSTVHGFAKLALEGKFGVIGNGRREIMATLRQVLEYLWPTKSA